MPSERVQRQIDRFLDEAEAAMARSDWPLARDRAANALALDPANADARHYLDASERALAGGGLTLTPTLSQREREPDSEPSPPGRGQGERGPANPLAAPAGISDPTALYPAPSWAATLNSPSPACTWPNCCWITTPPSGPRPSST